MNKFLRFPQIQHLVWLGQELPRDDKVMSFSTVQAFLSSEVVVEEKLDGANLGISLGENGELLLQNRGTYITAPYSGQFARLQEWLPYRQEDIKSLLGKNLILFGEWCAAQHSIPYNRLPDWFMVFDVYDRETKSFWNTPRRNEIAQLLGLHVVPLCFSGRINLKDLKERLNRTPSYFQDGPLEGFILRNENSDRLVERAKIVRPQFVQGMGEHWRNQPVTWNRLKL